MGSHRVGWRFLGKNWHPLWSGRKTHLCSSKGGMCLRGGGGSREKLTGTWKAAWNPWADKEWRQISAGLEGKLEKETAIIRVARITVHL